MPVNGANAVIADATAVPMSAIARAITIGDAIVAETRNAMRGSNDPTAHAEMVAIRAAAQSVQNYRLPGSMLYVTLEPCSMCAGLIVHARIARVVFAASEPRAGVAISQGQFFDQAFLNHRVLVEGGLLAEESGALLKDFFKARRG